MALLQVNCFSNVLRKCINFHVILPQTTTQQIGLSSNVEHVREDTYPVLYLLHGMSDDYTCWCRRTSLERYANQYSLAIVMPDGDLSWYCNTSYGLNYRTFIAEELPQICHDFFPRISTAREDTFLAGNSMGGYGAYQIALHYPDRYSYIGGFSAALSISDVLDRNDISQTDRAFWDGIFGVDVAKRRENYDIVALASKIPTEDRKLLHFYETCGTEDFLYDSQKQIVTELSDLQFPVTYHERSGTHCWEFWDAELPRFLEWLPIQRPQL